MPRSFVYCGTESAEVVCCELFADGHLEQRQVLVVDPNALSLPNGAPDGIAIEWVAAHPSGEVVYALVSVWDTGSGTIRTLKIDHLSGSMSLVGDPVSTGGIQPGHAVIDGSHLIVAHYLSGDVCVFDISDAYLPKLLQTVAMPNLIGGPPNEPFKAPHPHGGPKAPMCHGVIVSPSGKWLVACDCGQSAIVTFTYDRNSAASPLGQPRHQPAPKPTPIGEHNMVEFAGHRPRHAAFSSAGHLLLLHEMNNVVSMHTFDEQTGEMGPELGTQPSFPHELPATAPPGGFWAASEIALHPPSGRVFATTRAFGAGFTYVANGNFVRSFTADTVDTHPRLSAAQDVAALANPRCLTFDPSMRWMVVGAQGGFISYPISSDGQMGAGRESRLADGYSQMSVDCIVVVEASCAESSAT